MSRLTEISKEIGWLPPWPALKYPRDDEVKILSEYANQGNQSAFAQLYRYMRFLCSPKTAVQKAIIVKISKAFNEAKKNI